MITGVTLTVGVSTATIGAVLLGKGLSRGVGVAAAGVVSAAHPAARRIKTANEIVVLRRAAPKNLGQTPCAAGRLTERLGALSGLLRPRIAADYISSL
jgi:hypothetical protein